MSKMKMLYPEQSESLLVRSGETVDHTENATYRLETTIKYEAWGNRYNSKLPQMSIKDILKNCAKILKVESVFWICLLRGQHSYNTYHYAKDDNGYTVKVEGEKGWLYKVNNLGATEVLSGTGKYLKVIPISSQDYKAASKRMMNHWAFRYEGDLDLIYQATSGYVGHGAGYGGASPEYPEDGIVVMYQSNSCD